MTRIVTLLICGILASGCNSSDESESSADTGLEDELVTEADEATQDYTTATSLQISVEPNDVDLNNGENTTSVFSLAFNSNGQEVRIGQFNNGDYWLSPAQGESCVSITQITGSGVISGGIDPQLESHGIGTGVNGYGSYDASLNVANQLPLEICEDSSLVLAMNRDEASTSNCDTSAIVGECIDAYLVLTVLLDPPADLGANTFRPPISLDEKVLLTWDDFDLSTIPSLAYLDGTDATGFEQMRRKWAHSTEIFSLFDAQGNYYSEGGRAFRAHNMVDDYAAGVASAWSSDLATHYADATGLDDPDKLAALAAQMSYALDIYHAVHSASVTRYYGSGAGQFLGRFPAVAWVVNLIDDNSSAAYYKAVVSEVSSSIADDDNLGPQELNQINEGHNGPIWGDVRESSPIASYWADLVDSQCYDGATGSCNTNNGSKAQQDPYGYIDGPATKPGVSYSLIHLGATRSVVAIMCVTPGMAELINDDNLISYVDRQTNTGIKTTPDDCAPPDPREDFSTCSPYKTALNSSGTAQSYQAATGCEYIGETWGPDPDDPTNLCIANNSGENEGQTGRFSEVSGFIDPSFTSSQLEANYELMRGSSDDCRSF